MSTFLQLCQKLARESGSVSGGATQPGSVTGQSGRLAKLVGWVSDAWVEIQDSRKDWLFLQKKFSSALILNVMEYTGASFGLADLGGWRDGGRDYSIYDPDLGPSDEAFLIPLDYDKFYELYLIGQHDPQRPRHYANAPDGSLCIAPKPDKVYPINGRYRRAAQVLAANTDVPICAEQHDVIVWHAMKSLEGSDEAPTAFEFSDTKYQRYWNSFLRAYTPKIGNTNGTAGSPLA